MSDQAVATRPGGVEPRYSRLMSRVGRRDTKPEMLVRRHLYAHGLRYRLQAKELLGKPDVVFRRQKLAIFVHGCFWHRHQGCSKASTPKTRTAFWDAKFARNVERDAESERLLTEAGWTVVTIWECEAKDPKKLEARLKPVIGKAARQ